MTMKKLSDDIQSLFCASRKIRSYKRAVEELVCNSLDADSTSIAIRVNIEDDTIQVIDNGCGIEKNDFKLLGLRYTTSKCNDLSVLKSAPKKYGYQGQSLASIIEVSQTVKITSRSVNKEETWMKTFYRGKEKQLCATSQRPSKGTTVEIKGFLYNLNIQKKSLTAFKELLDIKTFLEHISVVHSNISLSLRDDTKNEIIFKLHKKRDIYQTLLSLFGIDRTEVQELRVEKNQYSVTAFMGKKDNDIRKMYWIYLNGKFIFNTKLHELVDNFLIKSLYKNPKSDRKIKSKNAYNQDENISSKNRIPFYLIFIACPYYDYDISNTTTKKSYVEFKNWEQITKLLEKLIKFYVGDHNMKLISKPIANPNKNKVNEDKTRHQVKEIIEKFLGSHTKKIGVSQMQNGIKGKRIKRKHKKHNPIPKISLSKVIPPKNIHVDIPTRSNDIPQLYVNENLKDVDKQENIYEIKEVSEKLSNNLNSNNTYLQTIKTKTNILNKEIKQRNLKVRKLLGDKITKRKNQHVSRKKIQKHETSAKFRKPNMCMSSMKQEKNKKISRINNNMNKKFKDPLINKFEDESNSVKQRCDLLAREVENLLSYKKKRKRRIFINETVQYSNIKKNNRNISIRKQVGEIVVRDFVPLPPRSNLCIFDDHIWDGIEKKKYKSSYDLVQTILKTQHSSRPINNELINSKSEESDNSFSSHHKEEEDNFDLEKRSNSVLPRQTYESHNYKISQTTTSHEEKCQQNPRSSKFITTQSRNNFTVTKEKRTIKDNYRIGHKKHYKYTQHPHKLTKLNNYFSKARNNFMNFQESSYTIEFTGSHQKSILHSDDNKSMTNTKLFDSQQNDNLRTYTISGDNDDILADVRNLTYTKEMNSSHRCTINYNTQSNSSKENAIYESHKTYSIHEVGDNLQYYREKYWQNVSFAKNNEKNHNGNILFISESQKSSDKSFEKGINPLDVCQTFHSNDVFEDLDLNEQQWNDSLFNGNYYLNTQLFDRNAYIQQHSSQIRKTNTFNEVSHHFEIWPEVNKKIIDNNDTTAVDETNNVQNDNEPIHLNNDTQNKAKIEMPASVNCNNKLTTIKNTNSNFNLRNRLRFVPKGMSPIFENCESKNMHGYNLDREYYENNLYRNFADNVQINTEIYEPSIQNLKELTTKDIDKVTNKLLKDNASLIFNGEVLREAHVLGQVDMKFIAAKINGRSHQKSHDYSEFLVLFDQHAVHERIKLEENLSDYCNGKEWNNVAVDDVSLKLHKDDILYLHNYEDKFTQFGLRWKNLNKNELLLCGIPEAILGKNPRAVEVVVKAVKNLILEEIYAIKSQSGCVSLYPKSIMDLVNSEACRYAIKFGDRLSKNECVELLKSLSHCKTPFQCAHGRPVMAVLMDIEIEKRQYGVNLSKVFAFKKNIII